MIMTELEDIQLIRYCRDNNKMNLVPVGLNSANSSVTCTDSLSSHECIVTLDQLESAMDYVEFPSFWTSDKAIELTGQNCIATLIAYCFEHDLEELKELCNVAALIVEFEKTIGYVQ